ncbi:MAG: DMT family transporter [Spirulinaceae cyanobacterium]
MRFWQKPTPWQVGTILIVGVLAVSTAAIFIRLAMETAQIRSVGFSLFLAASRLAIASLLIVLPQGRSRFALPLNSQSFYYAVGAGVCLAVHFAAWITSLSLTSIAASTTLVTTNPVWVALLSWLWFKEKPGKIAIFGIAIALAGGIFIAWGGSESLNTAPNPLLGNGLALIGAWMASLYLLLGREAQNRGLGTNGYIKIAYSTAALVLLPLPWFFGGQYGGYPAAVYLYIFLMALISQVLGHTSVNWAVRWISPTLVTLGILFEPVGASVLGFFIFGEMPQPQTIWGAIILLLGVGTTVIGTRDRDGQTPSTG